MKAYKAIISAFITSITIAAILFYGVMLLVFLSNYKLSEPFIDFDAVLIVSVFYAIYFIIQSLLSTLCLILVNDMVRKGKYGFEDNTLKNTLLRAELILYVTIFIILALILVKLTGIYGCIFIFIFSIPYIICCTVSVFLSIYFLKKQTITESNED